MKATAKQKTQLFFLSTALFAMLYLSYKLPNDDYNEVMSNPIYTIGIIINVGWKTIDVSYIINNKMYVYTQNKPYKNLIVGEEFYTIVSKQHLNKALILYSQPILDTIKYKFTEVSPLDIDKLIIDRSELLFTYKIGTVEYERIQKYEKGKRPNKVENLKVKYRIDRPEIGYLVEAEK